MRVLEKHGYTFDDFLLVPGKSLDSRSEADTRTKLAEIELDVPIVSANMDTITEDRMALAMWEAGGLGILHRYAKPESVIEWIRNIRLVTGEESGAIPSIGLSEEDTEAAEAYWIAGARTICVDVANAYSDRAVRQVAAMKKLGFKVIAGNVATPEAMWALIQVGGADVVKIGIGPGSVCTTRIVTGHGVPQLTAIMDCATSLSQSPVYCDKIQLIADGGIRNSGDIVKALAAGAHAVMIGSLLSGTNETPAHANGVYRGMASHSARKLYNEHGGAVSYGAEEGIVRRAERKGSVQHVINDLASGLRSGMSYSGAPTLYDLREFSEFMLVTPNAVRENGPHFQEA